MGVLNVTPDSFSDGGQFDSIDAAVAHARAMVADGAACIDVGGESTRPGSWPVSDAEQIARIVPVIERLADLPAVISVDTTRAAVAQAAWRAGARLFNDISAGTDDPDYFALAAELKVPIILMHKQGSPATMQLQPTYADVTSEVLSYLSERMAAAEKAGIPRNHLLVDPGIGFGKTQAHNLTLLGNLGRFRSLGVPVLIGLSRKGFIGEITGTARPADRLAGSLAGAVWAITNGADLVRVHDILPTVQALRLIEAIEQSSGGPKLIDPR